MDNLSFFVSSTEQHRHCKFNERFCVWFFPRPGGGGQGIVRASKHFPGLVFPKGGREVQSICLTRFAKLQRAAEQFDLVVFFVSDLFRSRRETHWTTLDLFSCLVFFREGRKTHLRQRLRFHLSSISRGRAETHRNRV
jgi:hypothetical protein